MINQRQPVAQLAWNLYGTPQGTFGVEVSDDDGATWRREYEVEGEQGFNWQTATVDLAPYNSGATRVRFVGQTSGNGQRSDMAIDQFYLGEAATAPAAQSNTAVARSKAVAAAPTVGWLDGSPAALLHKGEALPKEVVAVASTEVDALASIANEGCGACTLDSELGMRVFPNPVRAGGTVTVERTGDLPGRVRAVYLGEGIIDILDVETMRFQFTLPDVAPGVHYLRILVGDRVIALPVLVI